MLDAEHDENELRKDFTPSERVAIKRAIEEALKKRIRPGRPSGGEILYDGRELDRRERATAAIAATKAGFSSVAQATRAEIVLT